jgi:hypothetical protein
MAFKMKGFSPFDSNHDTEPREPIGQRRPGELLSQQLAREAEGIVDMKTIEPKKPSRIVSPERHAQEVPTYVERIFGGRTDKGGMGMMGLTSDVVNNPDIWSTMGTLKRGVDPNIDKILGEGRGSEYSSGIVPGIKDTGSGDILLPRTTSSIADIIKTPSTRRRRRKKK